LRIFYDIGCAKKKITNSFGVLKVMEQYTKSLNPKTKIELLCSIFAITFFTFKGHNLFKLSSISTFFVPLDAPRKETQSLLEC
jgi:hypothetical protein